MTSTEPRLVAVRLPPGPRFRAVLEGLWAVGDAILPVDPTLPPAAVERLLAALRPAELRTEAGRSRLERAAPVGPGVAAVIATSGTGGDPKGVELTHGALAASAAATATRLGREAGDRWLACLPLHHIAGFQILVRSRLAGTVPEILPRFDTAMVAASDATLVSLVPTMLRRLLEARVDLTRFRAVLLGGAPAPGDLLARARAAGARLVLTYGMTETCGGCVYDGVPLDGVEAEIGPGGRIRLRGPVLMRGYRLRDDLTAAALDDGWLVTADLGRRSPEGRLEVLGRADRAILSGGETVVAEEVEALLAAHPAVKEAAVHGRDDPEWGQRVVAVVVPADPARPPTLAELRQHVTAAAPAPAAPRELRLTAALPRLASGKVDHAALGRGTG